MRIFLNKSLAKFDFNGTGNEVCGNINAPRAVISALIYCLRCTVGHDVPLNQVNIIVYFLNKSLPARLKATTRQEASRRDITDFTKTEKDIG